MGKGIGDQQTQILEWLAKFPVWHQTDKIANTLVPDSYAHTPREWISRKLRGLQRRGLITSKLTGGGNVKAWKITLDGLDFLRNREK